MPALSTDLAIKRIAAAVEKAKPTVLLEIHAELFPEKPPVARPSAASLVNHIRGGLAAEEIVDLWNVVFPEDHGVWYNEEDGEIHFNEEMVGFTGGDRGGIPTFVSPGAPRPPACMFR